MDVKAKVRCLADGGTDGWHTSQRVTPPSPTRRTSPSPRRGRMRQVACQSLAGLGTKQTLATLAEIQYHCASNKQGLRQHKDPRISVDCLISHHIYLSVWLRPNYFTPVTSRCGHRPGFTLNTTDQQHQQDTAVVLVRCSKKSVPVLCQGFQHINGSLLESGQ